MRWAVIAAMAIAMVLLFVWSQIDGVTLPPDPIPPAPHGPPTARPQLTAPLPAGGISGRVVGPDGQGIAGAAVILQARPRVRAAAARTFRSGQDGGFHFDGLPPGRYFAQASAARFTAGFQDQLEVEPGAVLADVRIQLWSGGRTITGQVLDAGGGFIAQARVQATSYARNAEGTHDPRAFHSEADAEGRFSLKLPEGRHRLLVDADGYAAVTETIELHSDQTKDFKLEPAARISGRVVSANGAAPVAGARVSVHRTGWWRPAAVEPTTTDDQGRFEVTPLPPGSYVVKAQKDGLLGALPQPLTIDATDAIDDLEVVVSPGLLLRGRVTDAKGPVASARVRLSALDQALRPSLPPAQQLADDQGRYVLEGLVSGRYRLVVEAEDHASHSEPIAIATDVTRDVVLEAPAVVTGVVVKANGQPAVGALVSGSVGASTPGEELRADAITDGQGRFALKRLGAGELVVTTRHDGAAGAFGPVRLDAGGAKDVTVRLAAGASVEGVVSWPDGTPAGATVVVAVTTFAGGARFESVAPAARDGRFALRELSPGRITLRALPLGRHADERPAEPGVDQTVVTLEAGEKRAAIQLVVRR